MQNYFIKKDYQINKNVTQPQYTEEESLTYQASVYRFAANLVDEHTLSSVLDIGCGIGAKLDRYLRPKGVTITGVDTPETISRCLERNSFGQWVCDDIENRSMSSRFKFDLIIAADVVEHLYNPDALIQYIRTYSHPDSHIIISTPERDLRRGSNHNGPPGNGAHVREWNQFEFGTYLSHMGLTIISHRIVEMCPSQLVCQLVHCRLA